MRLSTGSHLPQLQRATMGTLPDLTTMEKKELLEVADGLDLSGLKSKTNLQIIEAIKGARNE